MKLYYKNLYENIFTDNAGKFNRLRIITGYASSEFLSRIINDFPDLAIDLFIGMTFQGVSIAEHSKYKQLTQDNDNIKVFYQVIDIPNHMKVYEFSEAPKKVFLGSANFSENGFFKHQEILTEVESLPEKIFGMQRRNSLICTDPFIERYIEFFENTFDEYVSDDEYESKGKDDNSSEKYRLIYTEQRKIAKHKWELLKDNRDPRYYNKFNVSIMLPPEKNPRWQERGINSWKNNRTPVIEQTPRLAFSKVFPQEEFIIYTDDNQILKARLKGKFSGNLDIINLNLYDYIRKRIGLLEKRPITYYDLILAGYATMYFVRINYNEYAMSFHEEDKIF